MAKQSCYACRADRHTPGQIFGADLPLFFQAVKGVIDPVFQFVQLPEQRQRAERVAQPQKLFRQYPIVHIDNLPQS